MGDPARWGLIASAVAGRPVPLTPTGSGPAYGDGAGLHLPPDCPVHTVMVQAALLAAGSLDPVGVRLLAGRRGSTGRYLCLEARRAVRVASDVLPAGLVDRAEELHPGPVSGSAAESLRRAGSTGIPVAPAWCGAIRPLRLRHGGTGTAAVSDRDLLDLARLRDGLEELDTGDEAGDRSRILELLASPLSNPLATRLARMLGMGTSPGASPDGGHEFGIGGRRPGAGAGVGRRAPDREVPGEQSGPAPASGHRYDEWCYRSEGYRRDWCSVTELLPDTAHPVSPPPVPPDVPLRRQLARLGQAPARHRRQPEGETLDATALTDHAVDLRAGVADRPRVYEARRRTRRDLGVLVLLDASGSTGGGPAGGAEVFEAQRELTDRLTAGLAELGDRVAAHAFYSRGRDQVRFLRVKDFDQRYDHAARTRLAALRPGGYTRLGAAVRHATHLLATRAGTATTLLVVVGDGMPYDEGYEHRHAQRDACRALTEAVQRGVGCACVSLRSPTRPEVVQAVWGHVAHRALDRPGDLAAQVGPLFRQALAEAAATRRATSATGRATSATGRATTAA